MSFTISPLATIIVKLFASISRNSLFSLAHSFPPFGMRRVYRTYNIMPIVLKKTQSRYTSKLCLLEQIYK